MEFDNLLKQANYTLLLPRTGIKPLSLVLRKTKNLFQWLSFQPNEGELLNASIGDLFIPKGRGVQLPKITTKELPKELVGSDILKSNTKFVISFPNNDNASKENDNTSDKVEVTKSDKVLFSFENAKEIAANLIQLDEYLQFAEFNPKVPTFFEEVNKGNIYVITSVLTSPKLSISNADDFQFSGSLDKSQFAEYIKTKLSSNYENKKDYQIKHESKEPLTFAVKTAKLYYLNSKYRIKLSNIEVRTNNLEKEITFFDEDSELIFS